MAPVALSATGAIAVSCEKER
ncbi:hypothetical protein [Aeromicrobium sp. Root495]